MDRNGAQSADAIADAYQRRIAQRNSGERKCGQDFWCQFLNAVDVLGGAATKAEITGDKLKDLYGKADDSKTGTGGSDRIPPVVIVPLMVSRRIPDPRLRFVVCAVIAGVVGGWLIWNFTPQQAKQNDQNPSTLPKSSDKYGPWVTIGMVFVICAAAFS